MQSFDRGFNSLKSSFEAGDSFVKMNFFQMKYVKIKKNKKLFDFLNKDPTLSNHSSTFSVNRTHFPSLWQRGKVESSQ